MFVSLSLRTFALSLIGIFVPVYLYTLGYSIREILLFVLLYHLFHALSSIFLAGKLAKRFGVKHLMLLAMPFLFLHLVLLALLPSYVVIPLAVVSLLAGIGNSLYWVGYHSEFGKFSDKKHRGKQVGTANIVSAVAAALGPLIGGLIIVAFGYIALYVVVFAVLALAVVPLFLSKDFKGKKKYEIKKVFVNRSFRQDYLPQFMWGIAGAIFLSIWPLIIYFSGAFPEEAGLGMIFTITFIVGLFGAIVVSKLVDKMKNWFNLAKVGNVVFTGVWIIRAFANSTGMFYISEILGGLNRYFAIIPLEKHVYNRISKSRNVVEYVVFKESSYHFTATVVMFILFLIGNLFLAPIFAAVAHLAVFFI